ncbi:MAG: hypothetical protein FWH37_01405 [Candidatus Bathyarchaeota archaeon]|nr:hypothetical protein [Candidatus Termiticorpusculum sp.]
MLKQVETLTDTEPLSLKMITKTGNIINVTTNDFIVTIKEKTITIPNTDISTICFTKIRFQSEATLTVTNTNNQQLIFKFNVKKKEVPTTLDILTQIYSNKFSIIKKQTNHTT